MTNRKRFAVLAITSLAPLMLTTSAVGGGASYSSSASAPPQPAAAAPADLPIQGLKSMRERIDPAMLFATLGMAGMLVGRRASLRQ
jgi:hypothetical protein